MYLWHFVTSKHRDSLGMFINYHHYPPPVSKNFDRVATTRLFHLLKEPESAETQASGVGRLISESVLLYQT
jgi:hypothetical protein